MCLNLSHSSYHLCAVLCFRAHTMPQPVLSATLEGALLAFLPTKTQNALYGNTDVES